MNKTFVSTVGVTVALALATTTGTAIAAEPSSLAARHTGSEMVYASNYSDVTVTDTGLYIGGVFYTQQEFTEAMNHAIFLNPVSELAGTNRAAAVAGVYFIPGIGQIAIAATGVIIVGGVAIAAGSWLWNTITSWLSDSHSQKIAKIRASIPSSLRKSNGDVDLGKFTKKQKGRQEWKAGNGWSIDKDTAGHGGKKWKLKNKQGKRVASLGKNGEVLGD